MARTTAVSCPGKVLIAGGYLVLDPAYTGAVVATASRFYTVVEDVAEAGTGSESNSRIALDEAENGRLEVEVRSPQFVGGRWCYVSSSSSDAGVDVKQVERPRAAQGRNKFVELALSESLRLSSAYGWSPSAANREGTGKLRVTIVGDNDFYSQSRGATKPIPFQPLPTTLANVHKTGLGSSAAMVTSLTSALVLHLVPSLLSSSSGASPPLVSESTRKLLHNLAQYVHSLAQGKVGSGFDVSAAMWGSHGYGRFDEECLATLLRNPEEKPDPRRLLHCLDPSSSSSWSEPSTAARVEPFALPPLTTLLLADVDAGSNTPSMVGKVLAWRKAHKDTAERLWQNLAVHNDALRAHFKELNRRWRADRAAYEAAVAKLLSANSRPVQDSDQTDDISTLFELVRNSMSQIREKMKSMGVLAGVPIEPDEQTALLDACEEVRGVVGTGVPGAGGYDAIWVLTLSSPSTGDATTVTPANEVRKVWAGWKELSVQPLSDDACVIGGEEEEARGGEKGMRVVEIEEVAGLRVTTQRDVVWETA